jgi:hypothetical protein
MKLKLILTVLLILSVTSTADDYIRPKPRKTLHLPWDSKPSSYPQQVLTLHLIITYFAAKLLLLYTLLLY